MNSRSTGCGADALTTTPSRRSYIGKPTPLSKIIAIKYTIVDMEKNLLFESGNWMQEVT